MIKNKVLYCTIQIAFMLFYLRKLLAHFYSISSIKNDTFECNMSHGEKCFCAHKAVLVYTVIQHLVCCHEILSDTV